MRQHCDDLIELDGVVLVVDPLGNYWVKFVVTCVAASDERPHGISYSLTIHAADGERIVLIMLTPSTSVGV